MSPKSNNYGIVYALTNPAMSDMVKIGMTKKIYTSGNVGAHPCGRPDDNVGDCDVIGAGDCVGIGAGASPAPTAIDENMRKMPTVGNIVGAYKSLVSNKCLEIYKSHNVYMGKLWQRDYYEHIVRNDRSFQRIVNYIENNPVNWKKDKFYHP